MSFSGLLKPKFRRELPRARIFFKLYGAWIRWSCLGLIGYGGRRAAAAVFDNDRSKLKMNFDNSVRERYEESADDEHIKDALAETAPKGWNLIRVKDDFEKLCLADDIPKGVVNKIVPFLNPFPKGREAINIKSG